MRSPLVLLLLAIVPASASGQAGSNAAQLLARGGAAFARHDSTATPARPLVLEPVARFSSDSDGNRTTRAGLMAGVTVADSITVGAGVAWLEASDDASRVSGVEGVLSAEWRPRRALLVQARGGALRVTSALLPEAAVEPVAHVRLRWRPEPGPALDVRARREPLGATPQLLAAPLVLEEARATVEVPVVSGLRARGMTRLGRLSAPGHENERTTWSAGPVLRVGTAELAGSFARTTFARPSTVGYAAPRQVDALDAGVYVEHYGWWPLTLVLDAGGGVERVTAHEARPAPPRTLPRPAEWRRALRLWSQATWSFARGEVRLEVEANETQAGDVVATGTGGWRWASVGLSMGWRP